MCSKFDGMCYHWRDVNILEVCAGLGLWAALIRVAGGNIKATDPFTSHGTSRKNTFINVEPIDADTAVKKYRDAKVLFLCWPGHNESYAADALEKFKGNKVVFIGEDRKGCTADKKFYDLLKKFWKLKMYMPLEQWPGVNDKLFLYDRISVVDQDFSLDLNRLFISEEEEYVQDEESVKEEESVEEEESWTFVQSKKRVLPKNIVQPKKIELKKTVVPNRYSSLYVSDDEDEEREEEHQQELRRNKQLREEQEIKNKKKLLVKKKKDLDKL